MILLIVMIDSEKVSRSVGLCLRMMCLLIKVIFGFFYLVGVVVGVVVVFVGGVMVVIFWVIGL